ncbi:hypothetical protein D3C80_1328400 [compost metagenome]
MLAGGGLAQHQHQRAWRRTAAVTQVLQGRQRGVLRQQLLHVVQLLKVLTVADQQLPGHCWLHALLHLFGGIGEVALLGDHLLVERVYQVGYQQQRHHWQAAAQGQGDRAHALPQ